MKAISLKNKVIDHIENVRDWLERAEVEYQNGASWQGELNLNLAQAELKKAWEESQRLHTDQKVVAIPARQIEFAPVQKKSWARYRGLSRNRAGLAAAVVIVMLIGLAPFFTNGLRRQQTAIVTDPISTQGEVASQETLSDPGSQVMFASVEEPTVATPLVEEPYQINHKAYNQVSFSFDNQDFRNPSKEVTDTTDQIQTQIPAITFQSQPVQVQLVSSELRPVKRVEQSMITQEVQKVEQIRDSYDTSLGYDLDTLIQLAEDALYVKK